MKNKLFDINWSSEPYLSLKTLFDESDKKYVATWAATCAEGVLKYFENEFPNDTRPRQAIENAFSWTRGGTTIQESKDSAYEAFACAKEIGDKNIEASFAAYCAGHAAASVHQKKHVFACLQYALSIKNND